MNPNIEFSIKTAQAYNAVCKPLCQELGLSQTALDILLFLANNPSQDRAVDIVRGRGMSKGHVSMSLGSLEARGLVARREDDEDRRIVRLTLTGAASPIAAEGQAVQRDFVARIHKGVTPEEIQVMWSVTQKIGENILTLEQEL